MAISAKDVMNLRNKTGLGMMECKQALTETDGDMGKAIDLLRSKGLAKMDSRADRASAEGRIACAISKDQTKGAIVEVNTETDFTAGTDAFKSMIQKVADESLQQSTGPGAVQKTDAMQAAIDNVRLTTKENAQFHRGYVLGGGPAGRCKVGSYVHFNGKIGVLIEIELSGAVAISDELIGDLCKHVAAISPSPIAVSEDGVPADVLEKEREIAKAQALEQGKPEAIAEKMVEGKIRKFMEEYVLLKQVFIKDDKKRVQDLLPKGVSINSFVRYQVGGS